MKCKNCGCEFDEGCFCPECGAKYEETTDTTDNSNTTVEGTIDTTDDSDVNSNDKEYEQLKLDEKEEEPNFQSTKIDEALSNELKKNTRETNDSGKTSIIALCVAVGTWVSIFTIPVATFFLLIASLYYNVKAFKSKPSKKNGTRNLYIIKCCSISIIDYGNS